MTWVEPFVFAWFFVTGLVSYLFVPPQRKQERVCGCTWFTNVGWWLGLYWFLLWAALTFCMFCLLAFLFYDLDRYVTDLPSIAEGYRLFLVPLAVASAFALLIVLLGSCLARVWWSILAFTIFLAFYAHSLVPCETKTCFYLRSVISLALSFAISAATSTLVFRCVGDAIYTIQDSLLFAFSVVFSTAVLVWGFEYWADASMLLPLMITIVAGILRVAYLTSWEYCNCCRDYSRL